MECEALFYNATYLLHSNVEANLDNTCFLESIDLALQLLAPFSAEPMHFLISSLLQ